MNGTEKLQGKWRGETMKKKLQAGYRDTMNLAQIYYICCLLY